MKKYILLTIAVLSFTFSKAQTIEGGIRGGLNYSFFTEDAKKNTGNLGFEIGYFESLTFKNNYKLQAEINYVNNTFENSDEKKTYTYNYLEFPVLIKYPINENFELGAGIKYVFGLNGKIKIEDFDEEEKLDSVDGGFGLVLEGVYSMDKINIGLRLNYGGGEVINAYNRTSANLYFAYSIF